MQYIRGAVSAISAPYQYYKDLPPINPSTLTGAIDVIVIRRPTDNGDHELACSPFHVRFGKWQVLRPSDKKVNVSVNGKPIPFDMKIGEAGEAFFVFETEEDVPESLLTSPILHATTLGNENSEDEQTTRFGAKRKDSQGAQGNIMSESPGAAREPDFLDLDAPSSGDARSDSTSPDSALPAVHAHTIKSRFDHRRSESLPPDARAELNAAIEKSEKQVPVPNITYTKDAALDVGGYHVSQRKHDRDASERTITPEDEENNVPSTPKLRPAEAGPSSRQAFKKPSRPPSPEYTRSSPTLPTTNSKWTSRGSGRPRPPSLSSGPVPFPEQEYMWEWGNFPQPSPMETTMADAMRRKGVAKPRPLSGYQIDEPLDEEDEEEQRPWKDAHFRSQSVPPEVEGSPKQVRKELPSVEAVYKQGESSRSPSYRWSATEETVFGTGGRLTASRSDPTQLRVSIQGRLHAFELALMDMSSPDEVERDRRFNRSKVPVSRVLDDDSILYDEKLVIRWAGEQYITRADGSPLMDALIVWRAAALDARSDGTPSRAASPSPSDSEADAEPLSSEGEDEAQSDVRSRSEPPQQAPSPRAPTSRSWVRWWSRNSSSSTDNVSRPGLREVNSEPSDKILKVAPIARKPTTNGSSSLAFPSASTKSAKKKSYAKTLRLSSDQLKSLNLKEGPNSITFSLSASGAIACTARIFVWDSTDQVVVSDIDGTITKSDGLGHFFTMLGKDWTHLGVAKLYTDITRNGYKIMYLTSRAIGQADATRDYLKGIKQNDYQLPEGPVIMSPDRLIASLHREVVLRKPEVFKMACLRDIQRLFGESVRNPFYAGFGNRITDALSYRSVNVPSARIFTIDSAGEVKMELLELAGYKSSYIHMTDLVDQMFPPIHRKWAPEFTDFNYWKPPVQEFALPSDLTAEPPSPALSARSDTTLARIRKFSLMGSRRSLSPPPSMDLSPSSLRREATSASGEITTVESGGDGRSSRLRQMTSFERLGNTLSPFKQNQPSSKRRSVSPSSSSTYLDSEEEERANAHQRGGRRHGRAKSVDSMPGSLPGSGIDDDDDNEEEAHELDSPEEEEEEDDGEYEAGDEIEERVEEDFDEDLLATGEMQNVPFL